MLSRSAGLLALGIVLVLPFLLRPRENLLDRAGEPLVIVTPHNEAIRYEFARGFRLHMREKEGRDVRIDWRTPGGTNEIARFVTSEYAAAFERFWDRSGKPWTVDVAAAFSNPDDERLARRTFLASDVGIGIDLLFGGGSQSFIRHAAAGFLVDSGFVKGHPEVMNDRVVPETAGGTRFWDGAGRWMGTCFSGFGICFNRDALKRLGIGAIPARWGDLADPAYFGQLALADPSKSGSAAVAFEMVIQEQMNRRAEELAAGPDAGTATEERVRREGWDRAMRLIRRLGANARYFTDAAPKIVLDIAAGDAAAGMCIDFYGRFQSEATALASAGGSPRMGFAMAEGGTAIDADPIALLRGAPHRDLALAFIDFVLSPEGQKLWDFKVGTAGGPERYALRRLPIRPELYAPQFDAFRSDPAERPYQQARSFTYHAGRTSPLLRAIAFIVKVMCVDTQDDLSEAYRTLAVSGFARRAAELFDDVRSVDYEAATGPIRTALGSSNPADEIILANRLGAALRRQFREVAHLARSEP